MKIFISHMYEERRLARAWKSLFELIAPGIDVWFSSDPTPTGGLGPGRWREKIGKQLEAADVLLALFTPESINRPWLFFESAFALGLGGDRLVIPITNFMSVERLPTPLQDQQIYLGDSRNSVMELCERLVRKHTGRDVNTQLWHQAVDAYLVEVEKHKQERLSKDLFYGQFHSNDTAKKLQGKWFAKWTQLEDGGEESVFEEDTVEIWTTETRLRVVGEGSKGHPYPMEGVVSSQGFIALSYWAEGAIPICGTVFLELIGGNEIMEGTWTGSTTLALKQRLSLFRGRVVMCREKEDNFGYWNLRSGASG